MSSRPWVSTYYPARKAWRMAEAAQRLASPYTGTEWVARVPGSTWWELDVDFPAATSAQADAIEATLLALWGADDAPALFWWPDTLAAPAGTTGTFEVSAIASQGFTITFDATALTAGKLTTGQWIVIAGVLYRVISTTNDLSSVKTDTATIFPAYRGRIGDEIDWAQTNPAKAPRWQLLAQPALERDEAGNLRPWSLSLRQLPYATYPF